MPKVDNITQWECDRCGSKLFAAPGDPEAKQWGQPRRLSMRGDESQPVLCPACMEDYAALASRQDSEFTAFLNEKGGKN